MADKPGFNQDAEGYWIAKDPNAVKNYTLDFSLWLEPGDSLIQATWDIPTGLDNVAETLTATKAIVRIGGGTLGKACLIKCHILTAFGHQDDRTFRMVIRQQ